MHQDGKGLHVAFSLMHEQMAAQHCTSRSKKRISQPFFSEVGLDEGLDEERHPKAGHPKAGHPEEVHCKGVHEEGHPMPYSTDPVHHEEQLLVSF